MSKPSQFKRFQQEDPSLAKLFFTRNDDVAAYLPLLPENRIVHTVILNGHFMYRLPREDTTALLTAVGQMKALSLLEINGCCVPLAQLCHAVHQCVTLETLNLPFVGLEDMDDCEGALQNHPSLRSFNLSDFRFQAENSNLDSLFRSLSTCAGLEFIEVVASRVCDQAPWSPRVLASVIELPILSSLNLSRLHLPTEHVVALAEAIGANPNSFLRRLDLSENDLSDTLGVMLLSNVARHHSIHTLNLRMNNITTCRSLTEAFLERADEQTALTKLNLTGNDIESRGAIALADMLREYPRLVSLELTQARITDEGCIALATTIKEVPNIALVNLSLAYNKMTTVTYVAFAEALEVNRTLYTLNLIADLRDISLKGYHALIKMLRDNYAVREISTLLGDTEDSNRRQLYKLICSYLHLNKAGRENLFRGYPSRAEWITALSKVSHDMYAVYYLVRARPHICNRR